MFFSTPGEIAIVGFPQLDHWAPNWRKPGLHCLKFLTASSTQKWVPSLLDPFHLPSYFKSLRMLPRQEPRTDKMSEAAILEVVRKNFKDHLILGEEGGVIGDSSSDYLWCIDPLDGTTNFAHGYPSFAVSVGVLFRGSPAAAAVVEFVGGPMCWNTRVFTATAGGGAFCNGQKINVSQTSQVERSLLVTGFGYEHDDPWATNMDLFKEFTDVSRGVRRLGAAAVDMSHVALGIVEAYWEYRLKPWDMAAGVLIVEEAGGAVTRMDGGKFSVFDRSVLVSNGVVHDKLLEKIGSATEKLKSKGIDFSLWYKPENYLTDL
ncbi:phosphatase IMPL1, chloroplastic isoform X2 [Benincasa hispida]|uniref:phosphatase IMPL1, chloroplastic isoform X2 n=1 Tax=Benincasa hispida TaxID=102211 RepID=UPI0018FF6732|nr:phosphatase IMPL1, chloroplastic isoform X2 [Benincasa hispida]